MEYRTLDQTQYQNDIALMGLVNRLKEYADTFRYYGDVSADLAMAAGIIDYVARTRDANY